MRWKTIAAYFHESFSATTGHCWAMCRKQGDDKWSLFEDEKRSLKHQLPPNLANVHTLLYINVGAADSALFSGLDYITYHIEQLSTFVDSMTGEGK